MHSDDNPAQVVLPGFVVDLDHADLQTAEGARVALRPRSMAVLQCLARRAGSLVTKDEITRAAWPGAVASDDSLVQCIGELRRALNDGKRRVIVTEPRRGYRLVPATRGPITPVAHPPGDTDANVGSFQTIRFAVAPDGARLAYASSGQGAPLVRAAHWMTHLDWDWRSATLGPRIQALSKQHRYVRYDGRGYGLSDWGSVPGNLDDWVADLETVVDSAGLDRFALLGASGGSPISIRFAATHPERVTCLVLLGGFARGLLRRGGGAKVQDNFEAMLRLLEDGWAQDNAAFRQLMTSMFWPGANAEQMDSFNQLQRVSCPPKTAVALLQRIAEFDASDAMPRVTCPTLVLHSPRDSRVPFEEGRLTAATIPGARFVPFDSPNHTPLVDEPAFEQVQRLIDEFVLAAQAAEPAVRGGLRLIDSGKGEPAAVPVSARRPSQ